MMRLLSLLLGWCSMLPIPRYLKKIFFPVGENNHQYEVTGDIKCICNSKNFEVQYVGLKDESGSIIPVNINGNYFFIINIKCLECSNKYIIFDKDFNGWAGFVCHDEKAANLPSPPELIWQCPECKNNSNKIQITIKSQGEEYFLEETNCGFQPDQWLEAFEWITIQLVCSNCNHINYDWVSFEAKSFL